MNDARRKVLDDAVKFLEEVKGKLDEARSLVESIGEDERESYENLSEGLQQSERGQRMDEVASELEDIASDLDIDLDTLITRIEDAKQ